MIRFGQEDAHIRMMVKRMVFLTSWTCIFGKTRQKELQSTGFRLKKQESFLEL